MSQSIDKEVHDFLARKLLFSDKKKQKEVLMFWSDLLAADFESNTSAAGLDSEDKAYIRACVEKWFYNTLLDIINEMQASQKDEASCRNRIRKIVVSRVRHITKDLLFSRKMQPKEKRVKKRGRKENEKKPAGSFRFLHGPFSRVHLSHLSPESQDAVFLDPISDAETQYLCKEALLEQNTDHGLRAMAEGGNERFSLKAAEEDIGVFLAKKSHLETLRVRLAYSGRSEEFR